MSMVSVKYIVTRLIPNNLAYEHRVVNVTSHIVMTMATHSYLCNESFDFNITPQVFTQQEI